MLRLPLNNKNKMNSLKISRIVKSIKRAWSTRNKVGTEGKKKKLNHKKMENTKSLGEINLNILVIPININEINFPSKRWDFLLSFQKISYIYCIKDI